MGKDRKPGTGGAGCIDEVATRAGEGPFVLVLAGMSRSGKHEAADLLAGTLHRRIHMVDLARVVSKYIGETEKNLHREFAEASRNGWILFFDEADALFGKRTDVKDAHDHYANMEVSHLADMATKHDVVAIVALTDPNVAECGRSHNVRVCDAVD